MRYSYLDIKYKDNTIESITSNNHKVIEMLGGDIGTIIKAQPKDLCRNNILNWLTENLSYSEIEIISCNVNVYRIPDVATKTEISMIFNEG